MKRQNKLTFAIILLAVVAGLTFYALTTGIGMPPITSMNQDETMELPELTAGNSTTEIEQDLNALSIEADDPEFADIESEMQDL